MHVRVEREGQDDREYEAVAYVDLNKEFHHLDVVFHIMNGTDVDNYRIEDLKRVVISE